MFFFLLALRRSTYFEKKTRWCFVFIKNLSLIWHHIENAVFAQYFDPIFVWLFSLCMNRCRLVKMSDEATAFISDTHEQAISTLSIDDSTWYNTMTTTKMCFKSHIRKRTIRVDIGKVSLSDLLNTFAVEAKGMFMADVVCRASNEISYGMSKTQKAKEMKTDKVCRILDADTDDDIVRQCDTGVVKGIRQTRYDHLLFWLWLTFMFILLWLSLRVMSLISNLME